MKAGLLNLYFMKKEIILQLYRLHQKKKMNKFLYIVLVKAQLKDHLVKVKELLKKSPFIH